MPLQYKIPQNVGIEDKIVGPLTLRQLIFLAVGFGISYVMFAIASKLYELNILEYIVILIPAVISAALALIKINNVTLTKFIFMFLQFSIKPKKRFWDHRGIANIVSPDLTEGKTQAVPETSTVIEDKAKKASNLSQLSQVLDSGGFEHLESIKHDDIDESHDDDLVTQAYFGHKTTETDNMYWRTKESHKKRLDIFAKLPITKLKKGSKEAEIAKEQIAQAKAEVEQSQLPQSPASGTGGTPAALGQGASTATAPTAAVATPKKRNRPRKRPVAQPARSNNQVDTTSKSQPAKYHPKKAPAAASTSASTSAKATADKKVTTDKKAKANEPATPQQRQPSQPIIETDPHMGELHFEELKKGDIELNLD